MVELFKLALCISLVFKQINENSVPWKAEGIHKNWHICLYIQACDCFLSKVCNHHSCNIHRNELQRGVRQTCAGDVGPGAGHSAEAIKYSNSSGMQFALTSG